MCVCVCVCLYPYVGSPAKEVLLSSDQIIGATVHVDATDCAGVVR